ncbi:hypothetical protein DYY67_0572 [Candidatus Nitrosotalea sp. TS]|nr:hypothetical protein [Candidatus Nitrosotalea sp. TS]
MNFYDNYIFFLTKGALRFARLGLKKQRGEFSYFFLFIQNVGKTGSKHAKKNQLKFNSIVL